jgi:hypothetical protein
MYEVPPITYWPAAQHPDKADEHLDAIYELLNPPSHLGNVRGTADSRSMVYATGPRGSPQALIFISFDPAAKLKGLKRWGGLGSVHSSGRRSKGIGEGAHIDGRASLGDVGIDAMFDEFGHEHEGVGSMPKYVDGSGIDRMVVLDRKGKSRASGSSSCGPMMQLADAAGAAPWNKSEHDGHYASSTGEKAGYGQYNNWLWQERAMHMDINMGLYFGLEKDNRVVNKI